MGKKRIYKVGAAPNESISVIQSRNSEENLAEFSIMKKAIAYVRVSSKEQEREGYSIDAQKRFLQEYANKKNLKIIRFFEEAETAKQAGRKQFKLLIDFLDENRDCKDVLVEKVDRMYRNFHDYVALDIDYRGICLHLVKENQILSKESNSNEKLQHDLKLILSRNYVNNLSEEVRKGQTEKAKQGIWPSCAPIGYKNQLEDHTIIPDPEEAPLIKKSFELSATGQYSLSRLKKELCKSGLRSRRSGKELGKEAMRRVLTNSIYYGLFYWAKKPYQGKHTPLITKQLFEKVQEQMGYKQKPRLTKHEFLFSGVLKCAHCGCSITADQKRKDSGKVYNYYKCTNGKGHCEHVAYLREERIEESFILGLQKIKLSKEIVDMTRVTLLKSANEEREFREAGIKSLQTRYDKLQSYIDQAYTDKLEGRIELEDWERRTAEWKFEQSEIMERLLAFERANTNYLQEGIRLMELANRAAEIFLTMNLEAKRKMLGLILSNSVIKNGSVEYSYKMPFAMFTNVTNLDEWRG
jgi:site-specific DNA recombinase